MLEREFELYLDLLGRLLRLRPEQRAGIADELRDHLEARLDELTGAGLSREDAVRRALEEFGDAAGLARHFTNIAREKRRRLIMRCTLGTVAVTAVVLLALSAFWPQDAGVNLPGRIVAQEPADDAYPAPGRGAAERESRDATVLQVESKLDKRINIDFQEMPLSDVLEFVSDTIAVDIVMNRRSLEDEGVQPDAPVTLRIRHTTVPARTALDVVLEDLGLGYVIRDGFIHVVSASDAEDDMYVEVYNVRDLVEDFAAAHGHVRHTAVSGLGVPVQTVQFSGSLNESPPRPDTPGERLIAVLESTVGVPWENIDGTGGTIEEFNGLLVVRTNRTGHHEIKELLAMMRSAHAEQPPRARASRPMPAGAAGARRGSAVFGSGLDPDSDPFAPADPAAGRTRPAPPEEQDPAARPAQP